MEAEEYDNIVEEREELMVSPTGGDPTLRIAHFLKPSVTSVDEPISVYGFPRHTILSDVGDSSLLVVKFMGWQKSCQENWEIWVKRLHSKHQLTWKRAGIYKAIMGSIYHIPKFQELVVALAEKWCPDTNTFFFPWGEATITLEDMMVLGGYSVLGTPFFGSLRTTEMKDTEAKLLQVRLQITRSKSKKVSQNAWMKHFMGDESELEHEAFLSLWLWRFVFRVASRSRNSISKRIFPIAIHLARGIQVALAPAVLASICTNLSLLKEKIVRKSRSEVPIWAPFQLVQVWVWERFVALKPNPKVINFADPRLAQWDKVKEVKHGHVRDALDSAGESFLWRPYTVKNFDLPKFYKEKAEWVSFNPDMEKDVELESFARCLRACKLVGIDCIQHYNPHRVAMQFGIDQDLPGHVIQCNETPEIAWRSYSKPLSCITGSKLYIPSRLFKPKVTSRYLEWWKQSTKQLDHDGLSDSPPGTSSKYKNVEATNSDKEEDRLTLTQMLRIHRSSTSVADNQMSKEDGNIIMQNSGELGAKRTSEVLLKDENIEVESRRSRRKVVEDLILQVEAGISKLENNFSELEAARLRPTVYIVID